MSCSAEPPKSASAPEAAEEWEDKGAMYEPFDAAAYRRRLEQIDAEQDAKSES